MQSGNEVWITVVMGVIGFLMCKLQMPKTPMIITLILDAILSMWKKGVKDIPCVLICLFAFAVSAFTKFSPILLVILCAFVGIGVRTFLTAKKGGAGK